MLQRKPNALFGNQTRNDVRVRVRLRKSEPLPSRSPIGHVGHVDGTRRHGQHRAELRVGIAN